MLELNLTDGKLVVFFSFLPENTVWHPMQIIFLGDDQHEILNPVSWEKWYFNMSAENFPQYAKL